MSRSGYSDDCGDNWSHIRWRGAVNSALTGKRGQSFLKELADAMDAMPIKRLIDKELVADGEFCTLGVIGHSRGIDMERIDVTDTELVADKFGIAEAMVREITYYNDEDSKYDPLSGWRDLTPEERWQEMRKWVESQIKKVAP